MFAGDLFKLLEGTDDGAFVVTEESEIRSWNAGAQKLFGYAPGEVVGKACYEALKSTGALGAPICVGRFSVQHCALNGIEIPNFDLEVTTRPGRRIWVSVSTMVFYDTRLHNHLIVHLAHDISKQKETEDMLSRILNVSKKMLLLAGGRKSELAPITPLSEQELRILRLFAQPKNSRQVAKELQITLPTLRNQLHMINQKLRTHSRLEAVVHALKRGLI
ncbi:MAG: PAS domain S-box protein [Bryobacteraceae bacterium]